MDRKKCVKPGCGRVYNESAPRFADGYCECGAPLAPEAGERLEPAGGERRSDQPPKDNVRRLPPEQPRQSGPRASRPRVGAGGKVILPDDAEFPGAVKPALAPDVAGYRATVAVFVNSSEVLMRPLEFDETVVGRQSRGSSPDIDLAAFDPEKRISRRHLLLFRSEGKYFARNVSEKNAVHLNETPLRFEEEARTEGRRPDHSQWVRRDRVPPETRAPS